MSEDLGAYFRTLKEQPAPPHGLDPTTLIAASRRARQRRRTALAGAAGIGVAAALTAVLLGWPTAGPPRYHPQPPAGTVPPSTPSPDNREFRVPTDMPQPRVETRTGAPTPAVRS